MEILPHPLCPLYPLPLIDTSINKRLISVKRREVIDILYLIVACLTIASFIYGSVKYIVKAVRARVAQSKVREQLKGEPETAKLVMALLAHPNEDDQVIFSQAEALAEAAAHASLKKPLRKTILSGLRQPSERGRAAYLRKLLTKPPLLPLPHAFYGTVQINDSPAHIATKVEARGEGVLTCIEGNPIVTREVGKYGSADPLRPNLIVQGDIADGATLTFYVNGVSTGQTAEWHSGEVTKLDLMLAFSFGRYSNKRLQSKYTQLLAVKTHRFQGVSELGNKAKIVSAPYGPWLQWMKAALGTHGASFVLVHVPAQEWLLALEKAVVDAVLIRDHPSQVLKEAISSGKVRLLPWSDLAIETLIRAFPTAVRPSVLPQDTYTGQSESIQGYAPY